jgi:antitoxin component YwqK of YwqJK toxin-antitoxin module
MPHIQCAIIVAGLLTASPTTAEEPAVLAIFDIEVSGLQLKAGTTKGLNEYLFTKVAASPRFNVVPRSQIRAQINVEKAASYKECYDEQCQIEIGKELAAQKSLSTKILKLGDDCTVTMALYDLRTAATEAASDATGPCKVGGLVRSIESAALALTAPKQTAAPATRMGIVDPKYCPLPDTRRMGEPHPAGNSVYCVDATGKMQGEMVSWHNNGKASNRIHYKDGKSEGAQVSYHRSGQVQAKGLNTAGRKSGVWTEYYDTGERLRSGKYAGGQRQGVHTRYRRGGSKDSETHFLNDEAHGPAVEFHLDGGVDERGQNLHGKRNGEWVEYRVDGSKEEVTTFRAGQREGIETQYDGDGHKRKVSLYAKGRLHGLQKIWKLTKGEPWLARATNYQAGLRDGEDIEFMRSGERRALKTYKRNIREGLSRQWRMRRDQRYLDVEGHYKNGKKSGPWHHYFLSGEPSRTENFVKGKMSGTATHWTKPGNSARYRSRFAHYVSGELHGKDTRWARTRGGVIYKSGVTNYESGVKEGEEVRYNSAGAVSATHNYIKGKKVKTP